MKNHRRRVWDQVASVTEQLRRDVNALMVETGNENSLAGARALLRRISARADDVQLVVAAEIVRVTVPARYRAYRDDRARLVVRRSDDSELDPRLDLRRHSPMFDCGNMGSGATQLALAILADFFDDARRAIHYYQGFKRDIVAGLSTNRWALDGVTIAEWVLMYEREHPGVHEKATGAAV